MMTGRWWLFMAIFLIRGALAAAPSDSLAPRHDSAWTARGVFILNAGQASFTNWAPGGDNQVNFNTILKYSLDYKKDSISWDNDVDLEYGSIFYFEKKPKKSNDKIYLSSKIGFRASRKWNYSYYMNFHSQFAPGFKYPNDSVPISRFMAPGYFTMGLGMDFLPNKNISVLLSPYTYRLTVVNDEDLANRGAFGVTPPVKDNQGNIIVPANKFKRDLGGFVKVLMKYQVTPKLFASTRLEIFGSYSEKPLQITTRWNVFANYKFTKKIALTFNLDVVYDPEAIIRQDINGDGKLEETGPRTQVKEALGLGMSIDL